MPPAKSKSAFARFAKWAARAAGQPHAFAFAVLLILAWALAGPIFRFSDTWQLVINTTTTIMTFLMIFLVQNSQNRDSEATQLKLDELIRSIKGAHLALLDLEELDEKELDRIREGYEKLARQAREDLARGVPDTDSREV
jgi:low affinity Fe/Cu permease